MKEYTYISTESMTDEEFFEWKKMAKIRKDAEDAKVIASIAFVMAFVALVVAAMNLLY